MKNYFEKLVRENFRFTLNLYLMVRHTFMKIQWCAVLMDMTIQQCLKSLEPGLRNLNQLIKTQQIS